MQDCERKRHTRGLVRDVWGLDTSDGQNERSLAWCKTEFYYQHFQEVLQDRNLVDGTNVSLATVQDAERPGEMIKLVQFAKEQWSKPVGEILMNARNQPHRFLVNAQSDEAILRLLIVAIRFWLFVSPDLPDPSNTSLASQLQGATLSPVTLQQAVYSAVQQLSKKNHHNICDLSRDFSAKNLMRKGGFIFQPTGDLSKHLTFDPNTPNCPRVNVFGCAGAVEKLRWTEYKFAYGEEFIAELQNTLQLLFPTANKRDRKHVKAFVKRYRADIEAPVRKRDPLSLATYPIFGSRLAQIQRRYDETTPHYVRQWWYDRRKRVEWATLVVAVVVFILTVIFGVISSVTGIMQVYAAYRWH